jgi:hypothetical protein
MTTVDNVIVWQYTAFGGANIGNAITALVQFINRGQATGSIVTPTTAITSPVAVSVSQHAKSSTGAVTLGSPIAIGDLIVVAIVGNADITPPPTVTDTLGNTYVQAVFGQTPGGLPNQISICYCLSAFAGSSVTLSCSVGQWMAAATFKNIDQAAPLDTTGTSQTVAPTITLTGANGDVVFTALVNPNGTPSVTAPEVVLDYGPTASQPGVADSYEANVAAGSFTSSLLASASVATQYASAAFRIAAISPPAQTTNVNVTSQGTVTHTAGALTLNEPVFGNGAADIKTATCDIATTAPLSGGGNLSPSGLTLAVATATTSSLGVVQPDGVTITIAGGVISSSGGGGGGALTLLDSQTASNSVALNFVSDIVSGYDDYLLELINLVPASSSVDVVLEFSTNNGSSYDTTSGHYQWATWRWIYNSQAATGSTSDSKVVVSSGSGEMQSTASLGGLSGTFRISNPLSGTAITMVNGQSSFINAGSLIVGVTMTGCYTQTAAVNAFRLRVVGVNLTSGTARLYGLQK